MSGNDIRKQFLDFFAAKGHTVVDSSSLVPHDDPTLLFTNAGMVQFKRVFMGEDKRAYTRAATAQRCVRAGGKHNDLENVGQTARHHTFFEMLGNFSFGDYFKEDAIRYAWEFLTGVLGLPKDKLWVSVFEEDDEAFALWEKIEDLPKGRIIRLGEKDNFWAMGDTGPCGPCSEILIDQGPEVGCGGPDCKAGCDCDRYLELWNLVFMQFYRDESGKLTPLPKPSIDTGMGLERISAVVQGVHSNYDSDLFAPLIRKIAAMAGKHYGDNDKDDMAMRVIADHSRATAFLVSDGVLPSNEGRGYVLRRIMRRAIRFGRALGFAKPFFAEVAGEVVERMRGAYPHLNDSRDLLAKVALNEEERFLETLDHGLTMLEEELDRLERASAATVAGDFIFKLYDTYGFPVDIVRDVALERGIAVDEAGFNAAMDGQRQRAKQARKGGGLAELATGLRALVEKGEKSVFSGYETCTDRSVVSGLVAADTGAALERAVAGAQVLVVCPQSPFYAESGGQRGDQGEIVAAGGRVAVEDTMTVGDGLIVHRGVVAEGAIAVNEPVTLNVAEGRRGRIAGNHTATHLLQAALRSVLGDHVKQSGSLVEPDRLRFDFTHFSPVGYEELREVERIVNREVRRNTTVATAQKSRDEAVAEGATALFGEKYGEKVRVVSIGDYSRELCGGTHVGATGAIGLLKIVTETGIAAGVRRIEAITGEDAFARFQADEKELTDLAGLVNASGGELRGRIEKMLARQKELEREVSRLTAAQALGDLDRMLAEAQSVAGVKVVAAAVPLDSPKTLREVGDRVRDKMGSGIAVLGGVFQGKVVLLVMVSKDLTKQFQAGRIIKEVAAIVGGGGGGRPDMAQAGGTEVEKLPAAIAAVAGIVAAQA